MITFCLTGPFFLPFTLFLSFPTIWSFSYPIVCSSRYTSYICMLIETKCSVPISTWSRVVTHSTTALVQIDAPYTLDNLMNKHSIAKKTYPIRMFFFAICSMGYISVPILFWYLFASISYSHFQFIIVHFLFFLRKHYKKNNIWYLIFSNHD